jgi:RNA polymerase sigma-70 factor (ECF subfamily)
MAEGNKASHSANLFLAAPVLSVRGPQALENSMDDLQAIRRLKAGDMGGLEILVARYQRKAVQTAYLITHDEQLAEDVAQETFVRLYQRIGRYDEARPFAPYLLRSAANAALNAIEKTARWVQYGAGMDVQLVAELLCEASSVEEQAEADRLKGEVARALAELPPRQRAAIVQRYYLGMNEREMAETFAIAPGTIKWLLNAARSRMRDLLHLERNAE